MGNLLRDLSENSVIGTIQIPLNGGNKVKLSDILAGADAKMQRLEEQLLAEQAKNSELDATLKILKINHKLTISELNSEQAKNKKLVEGIEKAKDIARTYQDYRPCLLIKQALNEVNNAK